jgi:glutamate---cysteine ligase / carboxylate-amine ligase
MNPALRTVPAPPATAAREHPPMPALAEAYRGVLFGVELEFFTVDAATLEPVDVLDTVAGLASFGRWVKPEIIPQQLEVAPPPVASMRELEGTLRELVRELASLLRRRGACLLPVALHDERLYPVPAAGRFRELADVLGPAFVAHAPQIASDQVNVGAGDAAQAYRLFRALLPLLPTLVALSAASPFRHGRANGIACNRLDVYDAALARYPALTGLPPALADGDEYAALLASLPVSREPGGYYGYVRPVPQRGVAAEIRCLDKQPTVRATLALVALVRAVVARAEAGAPPWPLLEAFPGANGPAAALRHARRRGLGDGAAHRRLLDELAAYLEPAERRYLAPLYYRLAHGPPAAAMASTARAHGLSGLHRMLVAGLGEELG